MKKILVTGFEPFGKEDINPSWECVKQLAYQDQQIWIEPLLLPCVFQRSLDTLFKKINKFQPDIVLCVGQAGGQPDIALERVAINLNDAAIPDNQGNQPIDTPVIANAPAAYFSTLPCKAIVTKLHNANIPASLSLSAGSYVCNHTMFGLLHFLSEHYPTCRGGFIHIPYLPEQGINKKPVATMSLEMMIQALNIIIQTTIDTN